MLRTLRVLAAPLLAAVLLTGAGPSPGAAEARASASSPAARLLSAPYRVLPEERARRARRQAEQRARRQAQPPRTNAAAPAAAARAASAAASPAAAQPTAALPPPGAARPGARLAPGAPIPAPELEAYVDGMVRDAMAADHIAGVAVSVVQNGQVVLSKGYGFAGFAPARPVDPDRTLFRLGSVSKTFTWLALLQEVEAGRVRLDQPVNELLPEDLRIPERGFDRPIRVRDLMTHTSGFEDSALGHLFERDADQVRPLAEYLREERPRRVREPGELPSYSNYGAALAGAVVAARAGRPFEEVIETRLTGPLGMLRTSFREPYPAREGLPAPLNAALAAQISDGFRWTGDAFAPRPFEYISQIGPAGSASSTASDMGRYMLALLGGGSNGGPAVYGPRTAAAWRTVLQRSAPGVNGWAHGFMEFRLPGGLSGYGHNGATLSFLSSMVLVPELNLGVFVTTNTDTGYALVERAPGLIVQRFYAPPPAAPPAGSPDLREHAKAYEGAYLTTRRAYRGLEKFAGMFLGVTQVEVTPEGRLRTSVADRTRQWSPDPGAPGRFRAVEGADRLVFALEDGRAVRFYAASGGAAYERLPWLRTPGLLAVVAALAFAAAVFTLVGAGFRVVRGARQTPAQRNSSLVEIIASVGWLAAFAAFVAWALSAADTATVIYGWPGGWLRTASIMALLSALLSLFLLLLLFPSLRGDWRGGWTLFRRLRHTVTVLIFCSLAGLLLTWGALAPWSA